MILFELTINNFMHAIMFQPQKPTDNPGLITNSLLLLPLGTLTFLTALDFLILRLGAFDCFRRLYCRLAGL
jgi:hypothetical protein